MAKKTEEDGMTIINRHIQNGEFSKLYLFTGDQRYLIEQYVKNLANALTDTSPSSMNYVQLKKDGVKYTEIADYALDAPFFADRKVVVVWNSKFFKKGNEGMEKIIPDIPDSTVLIFVEDAEDIDERIKLVKLVKNAGGLVRFNTPGENTLLRWIKKGFTDDGFKVEDAACYHMLDAVGTDMNRLSMETEKVKSYAMEEKAVTAEMVDRLCVSQVEGKIFEMIDALSQGDRRKTVRLYDDLLSLKEPVKRMLALVRRQYTLMLNTRVAIDGGADSAGIIRFAGLQPFLVKKYTAMVSNYTVDELMDKLNLCQQCDVDINTGRMRDVKAFELLVLKLLRASVS
jgi:DNA polymerase-3 subunit delta